MTEVSSPMMLNRMVQIAKTLVLLCMLIGCSQAFPSHHVFTEDAVLKVAEDPGRTDRERRDTISRVSDTTPPVCRVVNESLQCPLSCGNATWEVTYIMTDINGSGIDYPSFITTGSGEINITLDTTLDENGYNATLVTYTGSCCFTEVEIIVLDKAGNRGKCPFSIQHPSTTIKPMTVKPTSSSPTTTLSLWSSIILVALKSMLL
ncbi:uncharacterized protein LOC127413059 [Myxocyprinus asiaticus]|uniref:uncharacterized protein LOC127413059 n=1 Tax=Myxocyprinus asiaticus TaxID=70543 RepID=UPI00222366E3|nr:uncharacterized protein LOC127413059 [Myxocyprinus asiaticus]